MQNFAAVGPTGQKNYVFVDEHNRHKRLKVMRACEGCRHRKIKCDSATTNIWPCAACTRLKLQCVPPPFNGENDQPDQDDFADVKIPIDSTNFPQTVAQAAAHGSLFTQSYEEPLQPHSFFPNTGYAHSELYPEADMPGSYPSMYRHASDTSHASISQPDLGPRGLSVSTVISEGELSTAEDFSEQFGDLKIDENGIAPYLRQQKSHAAEPEAPIQDAEIKLPPLSTGAGSQIRIPPELMPSDQEASQYFLTYFRDIHPYIPVINRNYFYHQWHTNRTAISPLLLESIFACAGRMSDDPAQGAQWLALANKHEASFLDTPRMSTVQSLLVLLKARESAPKHGYYYRSWMTVKTMVSMAKDLDLHEHHDIHAGGGNCGSDSVECLTKTRVWQTLMSIEMMVGGPQGRSDMGVDPETVDISTTPPGFDVDDYEKGLSRHWVYFLRNARNIRLITDCARKLKNKKDWGMDPELVAHNVAFRKWPSELPKDLQVVLPADGSPPALTSHFIGNMHSHYHLGIVMLHRAQLAASKSFATDNTWRQQMSLCYNSAKVLCRLQESILSRFSLTGLLCMQRGINFTIYAILTCAMIHLVAITSPDPEYNIDARDFFTRHMRILEKCMSAWPMPETEVQINALRTAFSANIDKPFELRESFPYGTPSERYDTSPIEESSTAQQLPQLPSGHGQGLIPQAHLQTSYITPPISSAGLKSELPQYPHSYMPDPAPYTQMSHDAYQQQQQQQMLQQELASWNPTPIIMSFNAAFAIPQSQLAPPRSLSFSSNAGMPQHQQQQHQQYIPQMQQIDSYSQRQQQHQQQQQNYIQQLHQATDMTVPQQRQQQPSVSYGAEDAVFVTPRDWQQSVASVFDPNGLKRRWDGGGGGGYAQGQGGIDEQLQKRMR